MRLILSQTARGNVLTYPNSFYSGIAISTNKTIKDFVKNTGELKGKNIAVNRYEDKQLGWIFYNAYDRDYMLRDVTRIQFLTIFIGALLFASLYFAHTLYGKSYRAVHKEYCRYLYTDSTADTVFLDDKQLFGGRGKSVSRTLHELGVLLSFLFG